MLNPNLNRKAIAEEFAHDGRVRIENLLDEEIMAAAANGVGFFYCGYKMNRAKPL